MMNLTEMIDINNYPSIDGDRYLYDNRAVPRVTEILSSMLHEDYLMSWSNAMGLYRHSKYEDILNKAADIGSYVHESIEKFISNNTDFNINDIPYNIKNQVYNAFNSFLSWWNIILTHNIEVLMQEEKLVCKYFGGTLDLLVKIDGRIYLVDFKTSNHPNYKYFMQLSAYRYMLRILHNIEVDGCIILLLDKKKFMFTEMILDLHNQDHLNYINYCEEGFMSIVYAYYNRLRIEQGFNEIFKKEKQI